MIPNILFMGSFLPIYHITDYCISNNIPYMCIDVLKPNVKYKADFEIQLERYKDITYSSKRVNVDTIRKRTHYFTFEKFYSAAHISDFLVKNKFFPTLIVNSSDMKEDLILEAKLSHIFNTDSRFCEDSLKFFSFKSDQRILYDEIGIPRIPDVGENLCVKRDRKRPIKINKATSKIENYDFLCPKWRQEPLSYLSKKPKYRNEFIQKWVEFEYNYILRIHIDNEGEWNLIYVQKVFIKNGWSIFSQTSTHFSNKNHASQAESIISKLSKRLKIKNRSVELELGKIYDEDTLFPFDFNCRLDATLLTPSYDIKLIEKLFRKNKQHKAVFENKVFTNFWAKQNEFVDNNHVKNFTWYSDFWFLLHSEDE